MNEVTVQVYIQQTKDLPHSILIDVRSPIEYTLGHVKGSVNIPFENMMNQLDDIKTYESVFLICRSGGRSSFAQNLLVTQGVSNVYNVIGGMISWNAEGLPIVGTFSP